MDIKELMTAEAHDEGAECNIKHPTTGKPTDLFIKMMGPDSKEFRRQKSRLNRLYVEAKINKTAVSADDVLVMSRSMLANVAIGWRGATDNGVDVPFSVEKCEELYAGSPFVYDQVDQFLGDYANFIKG